MRMKLFEGKVELKGDYKLRVLEDFFQVLDENGNSVYYEDEEYWQIEEYDDNGNDIYFENSEGYRGWSKFDENSNEIYFEDNEGFWFKREFDENSNEIYYENSQGVVRKND